MKNLAIIPARSGSKGLTDKNIKELVGKPLLAYSIESAKNAEIFTEIMVSTDSKKYADIAREWGANVPFLRSDEQSNDIANTWEAVQEVLHNYLELGMKFETVCLLQPTSPLRQAEDIANAYIEMHDREANAITSVCEVEHSPLWTMILDDTYSLYAFRDKLGKEQPRQKLDRYYRLNGAIYIRKIKYNDKNIEIVSDKEYAYIMDKSRSVDIDTLDDFKYAEFLIKTKYDR